MKRIIGVIDSHQTVDETYLRDMFTQRDTADKHNVQGMHCYMFKDMQQHTCNVYILKDTLATTVLHRCPVWDICLHEQFQQPYPCFHPVSSFHTLQRRERKCAQGHTCTPPAQAPTFLLTAKGSYAYR